MTTVEQANGSGRSIAGAVGVQLAGRVIGTGASVVTVALTTRHLGIDSYGLLTTAVVFVALWTSLTELGIGPVIVRTVSAAGTDGRPDERGLARLVQTNIGLSLVYCLPLAAVSAVTGLAVYHDRPELRGLLIVVSGSLLLSTLTSCLDPVFAVTLRFGPIAFGDVASRVGSLIATVVVIASTSRHGGLVWFGVVQLVPPLVVLVVRVIACHGVVPLRPRFDLAASLRLLRESLPQTGVLIIGVLYWRADAVILTLLSDPRQVGAYGIAYTVAFTMSVLSTFFLASSLSTMSERFARDRDDFARFVESGVESMLFMGLPIVAFGAVLARPVITLLGSQSFASSASTPFALLLGSVALTFLTGVLSQALFAAHDQVFLLRLNIANLVVNITLNLALVPHFGAVGSGVALLVSEGVGVLVTSWRLGRLCAYGTPWPFTARLLVPLAAGVVVALLLRNVEVVAAAVAVAVVYGAVNLLAGPVRLSTVRSLTGRSGPSAVDA